MLKQKAMRAETQRGRLTRRASAVLEPETRMSVPPIPPPSPPPVKKRPPVVALAVAAGVVVLANVMWFVAGTVVDEQSEEAPVSDTKRAATAVTSPSHPVLSRHPVQSRRPIYSYSRKVGLQRRVTEIEEARRKEA